MKMVSQLHLAAQYLATAAISFLDKKEDDSHTNLGFSVAEGLMTTRPLDASGVYLALNYKNFSLEWHTSQATSNFRLDNNTHAEAMKWVSQMAVHAGITKPYTYALHYDLPYHISDDFTYKLTDPGRLRELTHFRIMAQLVVESFLKNQGLTSEIRTWPHHFDTGAFTMVTSKLGLGLGLSIPDDMVNDFYFYISGYEGHSGIATQNFPDLSMGKWYNNGFKGAVLPATGTTQQEVGHFFNEALNAYKN